MSLKIPDERVLPHKDRVLREVLAEDAPVRSGRRLVPLAAAAAVLLVGGSIVAVPRLTGQRVTPDPEPSIAATPTTSPNKKPLIGAGDYRVDRGPIPPGQIPALLNSCRKQTVMGDGKLGVPGPPLHARWVAIDPAAPNRLSASLAFVERGTGFVAACLIDKAHIGTALNTAQINWVFPLTIGDESLTAMARLGFFADIRPGDGKRDYVGVYAWFTVERRTALVRQRFVINGHPGSWSVAVPVDGLVLLGGSDKSDLRIGDRVTYETEALDADGRAITLPAFDSRFKPAKKRIEGGELVRTGASAQIRFEWQR